MRTSVSQALLCAQLAPTIPSCGLTRVGLQRRGDHGQHGGFTVSTQAVLQDAGQLAVPAARVSNRPLKLAHVISHQNQVQRCTRMWGCTIEQ